jgi:hypothetical protein
MREAFPYIIFSVIYFIFFWGIIETFPVFMFLAWLLFLGLMRLGRVGYCCRI